MIAFADRQGSGAPTAALGTRGARHLAAGRDADGVLPRRAGRASVRRSSRSSCCGRSAPAASSCDGTRCCSSASFLLAFVGADALIHATAGTSTRFEQWLDVAAVASLAGAAAARRCALRCAVRSTLAWVAAAAVLLVCPTLAGHALDGDQPRLLAPLARPAAPRRGGRVARRARLARARRRPRRGAGARRGGAPLLVVRDPARCSSSRAAGVARALTQLDSVSQLWETSYGRTILVKTALFGVLIVLGWVNRRGLARRFARLRPIALAELLVLLAVVVAVGMLTDLRPGSARADGAEADAAARRRSRRPRRRPARSSTPARRGGSPSASPMPDGKATVTLTGRDGNGVTDAPVTIDGRPGSAAAAAASRSRVPGRNVARPRRRHRSFASTFRPPRARRAAEVNRLRRDYDALSSTPHRRAALVRPGSVQVSEFRERAPGRAWPTGSWPRATSTLVGTEGIVIGDRRWDRLPGGDWSASPQSPLRVPTAYWTASARNAYFASHRTRSRSTTRPSRAGSGSASTRRRATC